MEKNNQNFGNKVSTNLNSGTTADNLEEFQHGKSLWEQTREQWTAPNQQKIEKPKDYQQYEKLSMFEYPYIIDIIHSVKPPYQPFKKYVKLKDLIEVLDKAWEEDD